MKKTHLISAAVSLAGLTASQAATIAWQPSVNLFAGGNNDAFVSTNGSFVLGFNGAGSTTTLNGVTFTGYFDGNGGAYAGSPNFSHSGGGATFAGDFVNANGSATFADGEFNGSADIAEVLGGALWSASAVTLSGLTPGQEYEMQVIVNDARGGTNAGIRDTAWEVGFTDGVGTTVAAIADLTNRPLNDSTSPDLAGDYIIGTFIADGTGMQAFSFGATRAGFTVGDALPGPNAGQAQFNAFQLRAVPEPSTGILAGLAGLGLILRRRR